VHQYIERETGRVCTEKPFGDWIVNYIYAAEREQAGLLYRLFGSQWFSSLLGWVNYDFAFGQDISGIRRFLDDCSIDINECLEGYRTLATARKVFERRIRYWQCRPMQTEETAIVAPADSRLLLGSLARASGLFLKGKFFESEELFGAGKERWSEAFRGGDFAICRLTPEKYHYNHTPVAGVVEDFYETDGYYHSCNPGAVLTLVTPYSKNKRTVTIIDTDVSRGTGVGLVAMVEVVALMIGDIVQRYSRQAYESPAAMTAGLFLEKGCPKSLYRPGSSTTVLLFQKNRVKFSDDLIRNLNRTDVASRYSEGLGRPLVETDIKVRETIGHRKGAEL
jgi:phosphatidylserine decarboxylase